MMNLVYSTVNQQHYNFLVFKAANHLIILSYFHIYIALTCVCKTALFLKIKSVFIILKFLWYLMLP